MKRLAALLTVGLMSLLGLVSVTGQAQAKVAGPNGQIVFVRFDPAIDDFIPFTINPDGTHEFSSCQMVLPESARAGRPTGTRSAFQGRRADGTGYTQLAPAPDPLLNLGCNTWSPDGTRLAVEGFNDDHPEVNGIYTVRASDGGDLMRLTDVGGVIGDYSPDGSRIVFLGDPAHGRRGSLAVFTVNTDGTDLRQITPGITNCCPGPSWSPDGTQLLFGSTRGKLFVVHPDGTGLAQIPIQTGGGFSFAFGPGWSPDGKKIGFSLFLATTGQMHVFTAGADGRDLVQVTNAPDGEEFEDWGPHPLAT